LSVSVAKLKYAHILLSLTFLARIVTKSWLVFISYKSKFC